MSAALYPIAETAEKALHAPKGFAERAREAAAAAGGAVCFVTDDVGPAFESYDALLAALGEAARHPACRIRPMLGEGPKPRTARPVNKGGKRWPAPRPAPPTLWRLSVSYWRIGEAEAPTPDEPARVLRRKGLAEPLDARALNALARQPLRPVRPQQPLDIGLFEMRAPEAPDRIIPDE